MNIITKTNVAKIFGFSTSALYKMVSKHAPGESIDGEDLIDVCVGIIDAKLHELNEKSTQYHEIKNKLYLLKEIGT